MELKRAVVTGLGAITPLGLTANETWEAVKSGKSGAGPITLFDASKFKTQFACEVKAMMPIITSIAKSCASTTDLPNSP